MIQPELLWLSLQDSIVSLSEACGCERRASEGQDEHTYSDGEDVGRDAHEWAVSTGIQNFWSTVEASSNFLSDQFVGGPGHAKVAYFYLLIISYQDIFYFKV